MKPIILDPPVVSIELDNVPYPHYSISLTHTHVKELHFGYTDYPMAVAFAEGIALGFQAATGHMPIQAFPLALPGDGLSDRLVSTADNAGVNDTRATGGASTLSPRSPVDPAQPDAGTADGVELSDRLSPDEAIRPSSTGYLLPVVLSSSPGQAGWSPAPDPLATPPSPRVIDARTPGEGPGVGAA